MCGVAVRMKGKMNLLNAAQGSLQYIIWTVVEVMKLINHRMSRWIWSQQFAFRAMLRITQNLHKGELSKPGGIFFKSERLLWLCWIAWKGCISLKNLGGLVLLLGAEGIWALRSRRLEIPYPSGGDHGKVHCHCVLRGSEPRGPVWWKLSTAIQLGRAIQNFKDM